MAGWEDLQQVFIDNGLPELADIITQLIQNYGVDSGNIIYNELRKTDVYRQRFAGNFERLANGKPLLSEAEYLYQERAYAETLAAYGASDLGSRENFAKFIGNDISPNELSQRFTAAYTRVQNAVNSNDKALVDQLKLMYPGITDSELAKSLLLGKEGSQYLKNRIDIAEVKAAEIETGYKSKLGAEFLSSQGVGRAEARVGLAKTAAAQTGIQEQARRYGESDVESLKQELERENLLGQQSVKSKRLASQARSEFAGEAGIRTGSLARKKVGQI